MSRWPIWGLTAGSLARPAISCSHPPQHPRNPSEVSFEQDSLIGKVITYNILKPHLEEAIKCNTLNVRNGRVRLDGGCCRFYRRQRRLLLSSSLSIDQRDSGKQSRDGRLHLEGLFAMCGEKTKETMINREKISILRRSGSFICEQRNQWTTTRGQHVLSQTPQGQRWQATEKPENRGCQRSSWRNHAASRAPLIRQAKMRMQWRLFTNHNKVIVDKRSLLLLPKWWTWDMLDWHGYRSGYSVLIHSQDTQVDLLGGAEME